MGKGKTIGGDLSDVTEPTFQCKFVEQAQAPNPSDFPRERRFVFVQLLFSLTIAEVARRFADLRAQGHAWLDVLPVYTHLLLATVVITTSWLGWSHSVASKRIRAERVF